jgi:hypothetical protein
MFSPRNFYNICSTTLLCAAGCSEYAHRRLEALFYSNPAVLERVVPASAAQALSGVAPIVKSTLALDPTYTVGALIDDLGLAIPSGTDLIPTLAPTDAIQNYHGLVPNSALATHIRTTLALAIHRQRLIEQPSRIAVTGLGVALLIGSLNAATYGLYTKFTDKNTRNRLSAVASHLLGTWLVFHLSLTLLNVAVYC